MSGPSKRPHLVVHVLGVVGLAASLLAIAALVGLAVAVHHGFSARDQPSAVEAFVATKVRRWSIPSGVQALQNPLPDTPEVVAQGRAHWADHCYSCHANDGSGRTMMGRNLYPKPPDMRLPATQRLSDGELYTVIEDGIRLTGMPAWGMNDGRDDEETWALVRFIRHLPKLTPEELQAMEKLNPRGPVAWKAEEEEERFLDDDETAPPAAAPKNP